MDLPCSVPAAVIWVKLESCRLGLGVDTFQIPASVPYQPQGIPHGRTHHKPLSVHPARLLRAWRGTGIAPLLKTLAGGGGLLAGQRWELGEFYRVRPWLRAQIWSCGCIFVLLLSGQSSSLSLLAFLTTCFPLLWECWFFFQAVRVCARFPCSSSRSKVATRHSSMSLAGSHPSSQFLLYTVLLFSLFLCPLSS